MSGHLKLILDDDVSFKLVFDAIQKTGLLVSNIGGHEFRVHHLTSDPKVVVLGEFKRADGVIVRGAPVYDPREDGPGAA